MDSDSESVLKFFYDSRSFIGINDVRDYFHFIDDNKIHDIVNDLEHRNFISASPGYPEGTASSYAPKGFGPRKLYNITKRGIDYIEKQGEFKKTESNNYNEPITNSPNAQMRSGSSNSQQNISNNNNLNDQDRLKFEDLNAQIDEVKKELSQIQQNITQSIIQNDKTVIEKLRSRPLKFLSSKLNMDLSLDKLFDYFESSSGG